MGEDGGLSVEFVGQSDHWQTAKLDRRLVEQALQAALQLSSRSVERAAEVAVTLADDEQVRALNAAWRGRDKATNVLSFPADCKGLPESESQPLGDVVLAFETVQREADTAGIALSEHCAHLAVHGLLHLLGYDHQTESDAEAMEGLEIRVLGQLGIADPYKYEPDKVSESTLTAGE